MRTEYRNGMEIDLKANGCDGCSPSMINGVFCHEQGCDHAWKDKVRECVACGFDFVPGNIFQHYCSEDCAGN